MCLIKTINPTKLINPTKATNPQQTIKPIQLIDLVQFELLHQTVIQDNLSVETEDASVLDTFAIMTTIAEMAQTKTYRFFPSGLLAPIPPAVVEINYIL